MLEYIKGAKCEANCANCEKSVPATFKIKTISLCEGMEEIENVLAVVCNVCGSVCAIPYKLMEPNQFATERLLKTRIHSEVPNFMLLNKPSLIYQDADSNFNCRGNFE